MATKGSEDLQNLPKEVIDAAFRFGRAVFRRSLKEVSHRKPKESEIERRFQAFLEDGRFIESTTRLMTKMENLVKASGYKLDETGRAVAQQLVIDRLDAYFRFVDRHAGRPKTREPRKSILNGVLPESSTARDTRRERSRMAALKEGIIPRTAGFTLRQFMRLEGKGHLDMEEAKQYVIQAGLEDDVLSIRANAKAVRNFIEARGINPQLSARLEKELSRSRKAIAKVLAEQLRKKDKT